MTEALSQSANFKVQYGHLVLYYIPSYPPTQESNPHPRESRARDCCISVTNLVLCVVGTVYYQYYEW